MISLPTETSPSVECHTCGWTVLLPFISPTCVSIVPIAGWVIAPGDSVLCERCARGWQPRPINDPSRRLYGDRDALYVDLEADGEIHVNSDDGLQLRLSPSAAISLGQHLVEQVQR